MPRFGSVFSEGDFGMFPSLFQPVTRPFLKLAPFICKIINE
jgi:hypothetical protein